MVIYILVTYTKAQHICFKFISIWKDYLEQYNYEWIICAKSNYLKLQIIIIYPFDSFPHQCLLVFSHWSLSDSKSPKFPVFCPILIMM